MCNLMDPRLVGFAHDIQNMVPPMLKSVEFLHIFEYEIYKTWYPPFDLCMPQAKPGIPAMFRSSLACKDKVPGSIVLPATTK